MKLFTVRVLLIVMAGITAIFEFFALLYKPNLVWFLAAAFTLLYCVLLWKRQHWKSLLMVVIQMSVGLLLSYNFFWDAILPVGNELVRMRYLGAVYGIGYFAITALLLSFIGMLADKAKQQLRSSKDTSPN